MSSQRAHMAEHLGGVFAFDIQKGSVAHERAWHNAFPSRSRFLPPFSFFFFLQCSQGTLWCEVLA